MAVALRNSTMIAFSMALAAFAGCVVPDDLGGDDGDGGEGNVAFFVKDAPTDDLSGVFVTFTRVEVHHVPSSDDDDDDDDEEDDDEDEDDDNETGDDDDNETAGGDDTGDGGNGTGNNTGNDTNAGNNAGNDTGNPTGNQTNLATQSAHGSGGWYVVFEGNATINLMEFSGDARAFLGNDFVPEGKYTQIRIHIGDAWVEFEGSNETAPLDVPSDTLRIVRPWTVEAGATTELTVDFDLERHLKETGQGWKFVGALKLAVDHREDDDEDDADEDGDDDRRGRGHGDDDEDDDGNETADGNDTDSDDDAGPGSSNGGHGGGNSGLNSGQGRGHDDEEDDD